MDTGHETQGATMCEGLRFRVHGRRGHHRLSRGAGSKALGCIYPRATGESDTVTVSSCLFSLVTIQLYVLYRGEALPLSIVDGVHLRSMGSGCRKQALDANNE